MLVPPIPPEAGIMEFPSSVPNDCPLAVAQVDTRHKPQTKVANGNMQEWMPLGFIAWSSPRESCRSNKPTHFMTSENADFSG